MPDRDHQQQLPEAAAGHEEHGEAGQDDDAGRAQVRLQHDQEGHRADDGEEGQHAPSEAAHLRATRRQPVRQVDDEGQLGELGRVEGGQPADAQPARGAVGLDGLDERRDGRQQDQHQQAHGDGEAEHGEGAPVAIVDAHGHQQHDAAHDGPGELRRDGGEDAAVSGHLHAHAGVDHQDAHGRQRHGGQQHEIVGLVDLALRTLHDATRDAVAAGRAGGVAAGAPGVARGCRGDSPRCSRCWRPVLVARSGAGWDGRLRAPLAGRSACPARPEDARCHLATLGLRVAVPREAQGVGHGRASSARAGSRGLPAGRVGVAATASAATAATAALKARATCLVVAEHVEGGGGRAEQHHGRRRLAGDAAWRGARPRPWSRACSMRRRPAARNASASSGAVSPMSTAAARRSAATRASSSMGTPLERPPAMSTSGAGKARRAAMTASGCVPCESLT